MYEAPTETPSQPAGQQHQHQHQQQQQQQQQTQRKPANESVSLLHPYQSRPRSQSNESSPIKADVIPTDLSNQPNHQKDSPGESSNEEKWFEKSNNNVAPTGPPFVDDESPFFLRNSTTDESPPEIGNERITKTLGQLPVFIEPPLQSPRTGGSGSEDFRSVIDDLTVENKRLRRKLRGYEKPGDSNIRDDKLFELRVHGLSTDNKKQLEELLKSFVTNLEYSPPSRSSNPSYEPTSIRNVGKTYSSNTSTRFGDSGYASVSASSKHPTALSKPKSIVEKDVRQGWMSRQQEQDIRTYLHDIPAGLLPQASSQMTDKMKREVVVRRLEQVFAGKGSASEGHQQPLQQQKVSQSAAKADRRAMGATGKMISKEGSREARIMPEDVQAELPKLPDSFGEAVESSTPASMPHNNAVLEQRPTRPLDLDPYRAQVASENIEYMRHLGFSPLDPGSTDALTDGHGWIYLNILVNMAQLHSINVTPEFIQKAISTYSKKLELSADGRKVRWKGGSDITRLSSQNSPDDERMMNASSDKSFGGSRSNITNTGSGEAYSGGLEEPGIGKILSDRHKLAYSPIFHKGEFDTNDMMVVEDSQTNSSSNVAGNDASSLVSSATRAKSPKQPKGDEGGPIIFYNKAGFYTDLTGDPSPEMPPPKRNYYYRLPAEPIGADHEDAAATAMDSLRLRDNLKGPLSWLETTFDATPERVELSSRGEKGLTMDASPKDAVLQFSSENTSPDAIEFEASGIGGVLPTDNFAISVRSKQNTVGFTDKAESDRINAYPPLIRTLLRKTDAESSGSMPTKRRPQAFQREIITSRIKDLPASSLPPPSYYLFGSPEQEDEDGDDDDGQLHSESSNSDMSIAGHDGHQRIPLNEGSQRIDLRTAAFVGRGRFAAAAAAAAATKESSNYEESNDSEHDNDDYRKGAKHDGEDSSVDLLAHVRQLDPVTVRAREQEFDSSMITLLAKDIPAGDSAATADGGSGFNSPNMTRDVEQQRRPSMPRRPAYTLKRSRGSDDSMMVNEGRAAKSPKMDPECENGDD